VSDIESATAEQIARLRVLWPVLNSRPEHTQEIVQAVMRNRRRLVPQDIAYGFSDAIERQPTSGWPPGPHEILGCVLKAAEVRRAVMAPKPTRYTTGLTFGEWWDSLPAGDREQHITLAKMLGRDDLVEDAEVVEVSPLPVPLDFTHAGGTPSAGDVIEWEAA
jgi:hypothetical protein